MRLNVLNMSVFHIANISVNEKTKNGMGYILFFFLKNFWGDYGLGGLADCIKIKYLRSDKKNL